MKDCQSSPRRRNPTQVHSPAPCRAPQLLCQQCGQTPPTHPNGASGSSPGATSPGMLCPWVWTLCYCHPSRTKAPGGWLDSPSSPPTPKIVRKLLFICALKITVPLMQYSCLGFYHVSSRSVKELCAAVTQREASVERVCSYSQQLSCGGYK